MTSHRLTWTATLSATIAAGIVVSLFGILHNNIPDYKGDWPLFWFWAGAPIVNVFPAPYPPTTLLMLRPFSLVSIWPALAAWSLLGLVMFVTAARQLGVPLRVIALGLIMPCALTCLVAGQISFFIGAALMGGVAARDPRWSGILLGLALALKPQSAIAVPIALLAIGDWRRLVVAGVTGGAVVALSLAVWGFSAWIVWIDAMPGFRAILIERHVDVMDVGVNGLRLRLGWPSWVHLVGVVLGVVMVVATWRGSREPMARYAALAGGAALISPYTLVYDLAGLSVVAAATLLDRKRAPLDWIVAAPIIAGFWPNPGVIGLACVQGWRYRRGMSSGLEAIGLRRSQALGPIPIARD